jgi:hypothetical protein
MSMRVLNKRIALTHHKPRCAASLACRIQLAHNIGKEKHFGGLDT